MTLHLDDSLRVIEEAHAAGRSRARRRLNVNTPSAACRAPCIGKLTDIECERRAQIDAVADVELAPTPLDWHYLADAQDLWIGLGEDAKGVHPEDRLKVIERGAPSIF